MKLLVTGAAGFIGSTYVRIAGQEHDIVVLDKLTYAGRPAPSPAYSALQSGREHAIRLPSWHDGLAGYLAQRESETN
ncbi:MAG TPA: NAD-dependent epimerase/dehydratase family protein [Solirubrobacterales bacterium]|nr:NAD-dependent epimerase/dehydratase family protein [Solirubrobacterales bacterium]